MSQQPLPLGPITLSELESHLWETANILRGSPVDRTGWKSYILPLLFFKRLCDVWDEEYEEARCTGTPSCLRRRMGISSSIIEGCLSADLFPADHPARRSARMISPEVQALLEKAHERGSLNLYA